MIPALFMEDEDREAVELEAKPSLFEVWLSSNTNKWWVSSWRGGGGEIIWGSDSSWAAPMRMDEDKANLCLELVRARYLSRSGGRYAPHLKEARLVEVNP